MLKAINMELYIEKEFLNKFDKDYNNKPIQKIVKEMFIEYGAKRMFLDYKKENFKKLEVENAIFALIAARNAPPTPVNSIKDHLFSKSNFSQTIVFTNNTENWFEDAGNKGALCFCFDNYQEKIKEIVDKLHFEIDLSETFKGWGFLTKYANLKYNQITIIDKYILSGDDIKKVEDNIVPILKKMKQNNNKLNVSFLTGKIVARNLEHLPEKIKERAKKRCKFISDHTGLPLTDMEIIMLGDERDFDFHDRIIQTNFSMLECGKGFILKGVNPSNSVIRSETIFRKFTYNRLKNIRKRVNICIEKQYKKQENYELRKKNGTSPNPEFYMFPLITK